jgi:hypothetical protein
MQAALRWVHAGVALMVGMALSHDSAAAQRMSVWLDANAAHSRPPAGTNADAANYGLLGLRMRVDGRGPVLELAGTGGRGVDESAGSWASGRAALLTSSVRGYLDYGVRGEAQALGFLTPVMLRSGTEFTHRSASASLAPFVGLSISGFRLGAEGSYTAGGWVTEVTEASQQVPGPGPLPPLGNPARPPTTTRADGTIAIAGGSVSLLRVAGPATIELRASGFDVRNAAVEGTYHGGDVNLGLSLGVLDLTAGARLWNSPVRSDELGGHAGIGLSIGNGSYLQVSASRTVTDMTYGAPGGLALNAGIALRLGTRAVGPPAPARLGPPGSGGRTVVFTLRHPEARAVAVAGDFSNWEPRALTRQSNGSWTLETVLPAGVYHYSFIIDGSVWLVPDNATGIVDDGFGQRNATLIVNGTDGRS